MGQSGSISEEVSDGTTKKWTSSLLCSRDMSTGVLYEGQWLKFRDTIPISP